MYDQSILAGPFRKEVIHSVIILISGASHTGKTLLAQKLLERYKYPYLSIDHLKMGLIRSGLTDRTPYDDDRLTYYLWNILREMIKTAVENSQNLIIEGCYIPFDWKKDFEKEYLAQIRYVCLVMSEEYIERHFSDIIGFENAVEKRLPDPDITMDSIREDNEFFLEGCLRYGLDYILIDKEYEPEKHFSL